MSRIEYELRMSILFEGFSPEDQLKVISKRSKSGSLKYTDMYLEYVNLVEEYKREKV